MTTDFAGHFAGHTSGTSGSLRAAACAPIARGLVQRARERAANDNAKPHEEPRTAGHGTRARTHRGAGRPAAPSEETLRAALTHFAQHGLGAARTARVRAEAAFAAGDGPSYRWWLEITRALDRRLAAEIEGARRP